MRYLIILFLISLLPFQKIEANISIDTIVKADKKYTENGKKGVQISIDYYKNIISNDNAQDIELHAFCLSQIGMLKYYIRELDSANYYLNCSREISELSKLPNKLRVSQQFNLASRLDFQISKTDYFNGKYEKSIQSIDSTINFQLKTASPDSLLLFNAYYLKASSELLLKRNKESITDGKKSLSYISEKDTSKKSWQASLNNILGSSYFKLNDNFLAKKYLYKSLSFYNPNQSNATIASTYVFLSSISESLGEFNLAIENINKAIEIYDRIYKGDIKNYAIWYTNLAVAYHELNQADSALKYYKRSINYALKYEYTKNLCNTYRNIGELYFDIDSLDQARYYISKSLSVKDKGTIKSQAHANKFAAEFYFLIGDYSKGLLCIEEAEKLYRSIDSGRNSYNAECLQIWSIYYLKIKDYKNALNQIQKALIENTHYFNDTLIDSNPSHFDCFSKMKLYNHLLWKVKILEEQIGATTQTDLKTKLLLAQQNAIIAAIEVSNSSRSSFLSQEGKFWITQKDKKAYHLALENAIQLFKNTKDKSHLKTAYEISEKSKAGMLSNLIKETKLKTYYNLPDSIIHEERRLDSIKKDIELSLYKASLNKANKREINTLNNDLFRIKNRINGLTSFTDQKYNDFNQAKLKTDIIPLEKLQDDLKKNQLLIEYYLFDNDLYSIAINKKDIKIRSNTIDQGFFKDLNNVLTFLKSVDNKVSNDQLHKFNQSAHKLYDVLIKPFEDEVEGNELIIIPDDKLLNLPFEILIKDLNSNTYIPNYLIRTNPIHYSYSCSLLNLNPNKKYRTNKILVLAPDYTYNELSNISQISKLSPLPNTKYEVDQISDYFETKKLIADSASKQNFLKHLNKYSIIHLAMHAEIDVEQPLFSKLSFTPTNKEDFNLYTNEIYSLNLDAQMIVLSACNTGSGKIRKGEGIMSFARGFLYAGSQSLTLTLWSVSDKSSADIMGYYYKYLSEGNNKSKALQLAKLEYLKTADPLKAHPYYWAGYIHIGNSDPIYMQKRNNYLLLISLAIFTTIVLIVFRKRFKNHKKKESKTLLIN